MNAEVVFDDAKRDRLKSNQRLYHFLIDQSRIPELLALILSREPGPNIYKRVGIRKTTMGLDLWASGRTTIVPKDGSKELLCRPSRSYEANVRKKGMRLRCNQEADACHIETLQYLRSLLYHFRVWAPYPNNGDNRRCKAQIEETVGIDFFNTPIWSQKIGALVVRPHWDRISIWNMLRR